MRGEYPIQCTAKEAQKAALRNEGKPDWRREPLRKLFDKLDEEAHEFHEAVLSGDLQRIREEAGDLCWVVAMICDHDHVFGDLPSEAQRLEAS